MFEYTVLEPFSIPTASGLREMRPGEHITDPSLFEILERPAYNRNVSRHYITSEEQVKTREAEKPAETAADGDKSDSAASDAKADEKPATGRRAALPAPSASDPVSAA